MLQCLLVGTSLAAEPAAPASENPYINSYQPIERSSVALQPDPTGPKLFRGADKNTDNNKMLVKGFDMLGISSFDAKQIPPELALEQAKLIKADLVLLYSVETGKTPMSVRAQQLKEAAKKGEGAEPVDTSPTYSYYASYWVKLAPPVIGVHVRKTSQDESPKGLHVLAAVEGSPAFKTGLQENDILTQIGDLKLDDPSGLGKAAQQYQGQLVDVVYYREGQAVKAPMQLNMRAK